MAPRAGLDLKTSIGLGDPAIETDVGEMRRVQLSDGSTMTLGGFSRASVRMNEQSRTIVLARGEAFFQVAKIRNDPSSSRSTAQPSALSARRSTCVVPAPR